MKKSYYILVLIGSLSIFASCNSGSNKQERYYYSQNGIDSHKLNSDTIIDLANVENIKNFIRGKTFVSKGNKMLIDDSLNVTFYSNGKAGLTYQCVVQDYILKGERLLVFNDSISSKNMKFTLAPNGILTNMETYALYKERE